MAFKFRTDSTHKTQSRMHKTLLSLLATAMLLSCNNDEVTPDETVFFKISNSSEPDSESFILSLTDLDEIVQARQIIANPHELCIIPGFHLCQDLDKIILAKIVRQDGSESYLNKDLNNDMIWSWRIDSFDGFVGSTIEILDGWPGYIEEDLDRWFQNTDGDENHGHIGLWSYTVVAEVEADDVK